MPQLDFAFFPTQIVWLTITFVALYFILSRLALPRISSVLEARQQRMATDLEKAEAMKRDAEAALASYEAALADARSRAREIAAATRDRLNRDAAERQALLKADIDKRMGEAERRIAAARDQALANIQDVATEVARSASERLIGGTIEPARAGAAVAAVLKSRS